jgi:hypothetical protein
MKGVLIFAAVGEAATGLALLLVPALAGIALIGLGVACWPGPPRLGMLIYSAAATLYLAYLGFAAGLTGPLLWPAVVLHGVLTALLARGIGRRELS